MLGKNNGIDPNEVWKSAARNIYQNNAMPFPEKVVKKPIEEEVPLNIQSNKVVADGLKAIKAADPAFSVTDFVSGAKIALEWVIEAFSKGDKEKLRMVLSDERFKSFSDSMDARAHDENKRETTLISILETDITEAAIKGKIAQITVQFTTEQMNIVRDREGKVIGNDPSQIERAVDIWTFERDVSSRDPNWKITAT